MKISLLIHTRKISLYLILWAQLYSDNTHIPASFFVFCAFLASVTIGQFIGLFGFVFISDINVYTVRVVFCYLKKLDFILK